MATRALPSPTAVAGVLSDLLGRQADVRKGKPVAISPRTPAIVGVYHRDDGALAVACVADLSLAAHAGASLALIPAGVAAESVRRGKLEDDLLENFREVLNVAASLLNLPGEPHVLFREAHVTPPALPKELGALVAKPAARLDLEVQVQGYGGGSLSLLAG